MSNYRLECLREIENAVDNVLMTHNGMDAEQFAEYIGIIIDKYRSKEQDNKPKKWQVWIHKELHTIYQIIEIANANCTSNDFPETIIYQCKVTELIYSCASDSFIKRMRFVHD